MQMSLENSRLRELQSGFTQPSADLAYPCGFFT
ncbi:protein of unknown function (plasmid) [Rhodovastum atsumiense]|nr:protein of unknown function [Rhodovastum atsumiense]